jgi:hypothetical protein
MTRRAYEIELEEAFIRELERIASELHITAGEALEQIVGELSRKTFASGATVATAEGTRSVITHRSIEIG